MKTSNPMDTVQKKLKEMEKYKNIFLKLNMSSKRLFGVDETKISDKQYRQLLTYFTPNEIKVLHSKKFMDTFYEK